MNVASKVLSAKLYELSGWEDAKFCFYGNGAVRYSPNRTVGNYPAYDLGYLLRKLPSQVSGAYGYLTVKRVAGTYGAPPYIATYGKGLRFSAETPEDAAAQLAIKLFEEGILINKA